MLSVAASKARTPIWPPSKASQVAVVPTPKGLTRPMPVTTTRRGSAAAMGLVSVWVVDVRGLCGYG